MVSYQKAQDYGVALGSRARPLRKKARGRAQPSNGTGDPGEGPCPLVSGSQDGHETGPEEGPVMWDAWDCSA